VPIDRPDENDRPVEARTAVDVAEPRLLAETRDPTTYYIELRAAVAAERWEAAVSQFTERWAAHQDRWLPDSGRSPDSPGRESADGKWHGNGGRALDSAANTAANRAYDRIRSIERDVITPAIQDIAAQDPDRVLVGLDHRLKGADRLKEKVADQLHARPGLQPEQAVANIKDPIRYTFQYSEAGYSAGVQADHARLESHGFVLVERRNSWEQEHYRGINSRWREPETRQVFEVQFHTRISYEAKQLTHATYERIRSPDTTDAELDELQDLQRKLCGRVPVPVGAPEIEDYPRKDRYG
jgi:hypothetical protein